MAFVFPTPEALMALLRAAAVPPEVQRAAVRFNRLPNGELEVEPAAALSSSHKRTLSTLGIAERAATALPLTATCWAAMLPPVHAGELEGAPGLVLFITPRAHLAALCGELLRLGCDRQELQVLPDGRGIVRVREPPYYVVARASEGGELHAFVPVRPGHEGIWVALGYSHPMAADLEAPETGALLIGPDGRFESVPLEKWTPLDHVIVPSGLPIVSAHQPTEVPRIEVRLSLLSLGRRDEPSLWLLPDGLSQVESLVRHAPEAALEAVLFAVAGDLVVLKARPGREKSVGALPGAPYARLNDLPNLYAPVGHTIEPPISRERVRDWLAADPDALVWLTPKGESFTRHSLPEAVFHPLTEWVDYIIDASAPALTAWERSATFDFDDFVGADVLLGTPREWPDDAKAPAPASASTSKRPARRAERPAAREVRTANASTSEVRRVEPSQLEQAVHLEETAFLELDAAADSPERRDAWLRLARLYQAAAHAREAGLAWGHAAWESTGPDAADVARAWAEAASMPLSGLLQLSAPSQEQVRFAVAHLLAAAESNDSRARATLSEAQSWLDKHDESLDVRALWLGRYAVAKLAGADTLALARARDRVLARLRRGLSLERDVPRFLRAVGPGTSRDAARVTRVSQQLEVVLKAFDETPRKRSAIEAPWPLSRAYVGLEFAWGFARLGDVRRARALEEAALKALDTKSTVHGVLTRAYQARIAQASEGLPPDAPLPPEHGAALNGLEAFARFRVDRLRQASTVLEPQERLDPFGLFKRLNADVRGEELAALREVHDASALAAAIEERAAAATDEQLPAEERARLLDGLLDFLLQLPESVALPLLQRFVSVAEGLPGRLRTVVLEDALKVAGHFGRGPLVRQLVMSLASLLSELGAEGAVEVGAALSAGVRSMRRVGLRDEAAELLQRAAAVLKGDDARALTARLSLAAGFAYLSRLDAASPIFDEALTRLPNEKEWGLPDRLKLARAAARALANAPTDFALPRLLRLTVLIPSLTDSFSTNDFFCLSVIDFADTMVVGHVGEDLTLSELTRSFLEEDEYLVRRRVHRDAGHQ